LHYLQEPVYEHLNNRLDPNTTDQYQISEKVMFIIIVLQSTQNMASTSGFNSLTATGNTWINFIWTASNIYTCCKENNHLKM